MTTILNIQSTVESGGEPGMLGMTLHPDFENTPLVYVVYNFLPSGGFTPAERLVSYEWNGTELVNEVILLDNIPGGGIHNGSRLLMMEDMTILMSTGDRGSGDLSQDLNSLNGKILRLNLDGSIPTDNPYENSYVYSYGHRNPQGLCHGPNGLVYSSEHGAQQSDELNIIAPMRNYGWPFVEGQCNTTAEMNFCESNNVIEPIRDWSPCPAVNGIDYYSHPAIPEWNNSILMAVLGGLGGGLQRISVMHMDNGGTVVEEEEQFFTDFGRLRDLCINPHNGAIYFATNGGSYPGSGPNRIVEYANLDYVMDTMMVDTMDIDTTMMNTQILAPTKTQFIKVYPNPVKGQANLLFSENFIGKTYEIISYTGQLIERGNIQNTEINLNVENYTTGWYYLKATNENGTITKSILIE